MSGYHCYIKTICGFPACQECLLFSLKMRENEAKLEKYNIIFEVDVSFSEYEYIKWIISSLILVLLWIVIAQTSMITINGHQNRDEKNIFVKKAIN